VTEAKPAPTSQASGWLPHMDIKKKLVKTAEPASSGLTVTSRQTAPDRQADPAVQMGGGSST